MIAGSAPLDHLATRKSFTIAMSLEAFGQPSALEQDAVRAVAAEDYATFERYRFLGSINSIHS